MNSKVDKNPNPLVLSGFAAYSRFKTPLVPNKKSGALK